MKKLLLSLSLLLAFAINTNAQAPHHHRYYRHQPVREYRHRPYRQPQAVPMKSTKGDTRLHLTAELGTFDFSGLFWHEMPEHFSVGAMAEYQIGHATSIGLGTEFYSSNYGDVFHGIRTDYLRTLPIYGNLRLSVPYGPIRPFIEGRMGYALPLNEIACSDQICCLEGLYTGGAIGLTIYNVNLSLGVSAVDMLRTTQNYYIKDVIADYSFRISFAFGGSY